MLHFYLKNCNNDTRATASSLFRFGVNKEVKDIFKIIIIIKHKNINLNTLENKRSGFS